MVPVVMTMLKTQLVVAAKDLSEAGAAAVAVGQPRHLKHSQASGRISGEGGGGVGKMTPTVLTIPFMVHDTRIELLCPE